MAYAGLSDTNLAKMSIGLRTPDYGELLPQMLQSMDAAHRSDPHYLGWARHSYNDTLK
jgi:ribosomal protein L16 Arg81 hydroxylase